MSESPFLEAVAPQSDDALSSVAVDMPTSNEEAIEATDVAYDGATDVDLDGEVSTTSADENFDLTAVVEAELATEEVAVEEVVVETPAAETESATVEVVEEAPAAEAEAPAAEADASSAE